MATCNYFIRWEGGEKRGRYIYIRSYEDGFFPKVGGTWTEDMSGVNFHRKEDIIVVSSFVMGEASTYTFYYEETLIEELPIEYSNERLQQNCLELLVRTQLKRHRDSNKELSIKNKFWIHDQKCKKDEWKEFDIEPYLKS